MGRINGAIQKRYNYNLEIIIEDKKLLSKKVKTLKEITELTGLNKSIISKITNGYLNNVRDYTKNKYCNYKIERIIY